MNIGHNILEWNDGTPGGDGYYLCLTCDREIIRAFWKTYEGPEWVIGEGYDTRTPGPKYIIAWAYWPSAYEIKMT